MRSSLLIFYRRLLAFTAHRQPSKNSNYKGFTLLELLISVVIASLVVTGLLTLVVELTKADKREANLDQVQRDMNRAMDYITDDLQEAVYIYPNPQIIGTQLTGDPAFPGAAGEVPVLAFWRIDPLEQALNCNVPVRTGTVLEQCNLLNIRQAAYTLVVYVQKVNDNSSPNWSGQSRIIRYELSKYPTPIPTDLTFRAGYRDPTDPVDPLAQFPNWQPNGAPRGSSAVLVDYVQRPSFAPPLALNKSPLNDVDANGISAPCRGYGTDDGTPAGNPLYSVVPNTATTTVNNTFFACVRSPIIVAGNANQGNQDMYIFLRGNVQNSDSRGVRGYSDQTSLPVLETQVLAKGVINKGFSQ